jgi:hypothetical protein
MALLNETSGKLVVQEKTSASNSGMERVFGFCIDIEILSGKSRVQ